MPYKNKEDEIAHHKKYYQENKEQYKVRNRKRYRNNREKILEQNKKWCEENLEKLKEQKRKYNNRICVYRRMVEEKLNHKLENGECVHHIDMDESNNDIKNMYIYNNNSEHQRGHGSLNKLVAELLKDNIIKFINGEYIRG